MYHGRGYPIAQNFDEVKHAIKLKHKRLLDQVVYYQSALDKIDGLRKGEIYEFDYGTLFPEQEILAKCMEIGVDRVLLRVYATAKKFVNVPDDGSYSLLWGNWSYKAVDATDLPLYIHFPVKTKWYTKALKKGN